MQLRPYQKECINNIPEKGSYLIQMATGLGKCFAKGTKIKMFDGSAKNIEDIKENELVMGEDSTPRKVKGLARGVEMMYKVTPVKGNPYVVNESHILSLKITGMGNTRKKIVTDCIGKKYSSGDICNISVKDYMACSKTFKHVAKGWRAPVEYPQKKVDIPPYILGVWLGDGTSSGPQITTMEPEIVREFARYCTSNKLALTATASSQTGKAITYRVISRKQSWGGNAFRNYLKSYNLTGNKHIPKDYLVNSRENRLELLAGLLDTDGYLIDGCCFEIASVSKVLSVQILELARSLGFAAYSSIKVVNGDKYYRINISGDTHLIPTRVERRKAHKRKQIKDVLLTGIKVESIGIGEYYGFEIEGDKKLFLLEDFTVVHNTVTFANIPRRGRTLILAHREELIYQPIKYYNCPVGIEMADKSSNGEPVIIASVQSLVRRLDKFPADYFDMIIIDECFPVGTLIDGKPIEQIKKGDFVSSYNHKTQKIESKQVVHCFKRKAKTRFVKINDSLICTENHPIYCHNERRYKNAKDLTPGDCLLYRVPERDFMGGFNKASKNKVQGLRKGLLLSRMFKRVLQENKLKNNGRNQQEIRFRENEDEKSYEKSKNKGKNVANLERNRTQTENKGRKWAFDSPSGEAIKGTVKAKSCCGILRAYSWFQTRISSALQNRHSYTRQENSHRDRWGKPLFLEHKRKRHQKREIIEKIRVDSVEILEQGDNGRLREVCPDGYVYNLEVKDNNNYFANGILVHNCHHSASATYKKICNYFNPRLLLGFTATPNRGDKVRLDDVFEKIIFQRDIKWAIKNKYLCDIHCLRVNIGYDLSKVSKRMGDFAPGELEAAMNIESQNKAIAEAYYKHAKGQTLIFATSVKHAEAIAKEIKGAVAVTADTKNRAEIIERFTRREIPVLVNCMIFTEGTDMPLVETVIMARPTQSDTLYTQAVGRGLRLHPDKEKLILIDCVGVSGKASLCAAPTLIGLDISEVPERYQDDIEGDLFDLPDLILQKSDTPESWIRNIELVNLWAKQQKYNTHNINFFKLPNGDLLVNLPNKVKYKISAQDELGLSDGIPMQEAIDNLYKILSENHQDSKYVWDLTVAKRWGKKPASEKQIKLIKRRLKKYDADGLTKLEASQILNRVMYRA